MSMHQETKVRCYLLMDKYVRLESNWDPGILWSDKIFLPYCQIGVGNFLIATIRCHYNAKEKPSGTLRGPGLIHMAREAQMFYGEGFIEALTSEGVLYRARGREVDIFYSSTNEDAMRDPARICRELLYNALPFSEWYELHASAVSHNGKAIAFVGKKGAGKTTLVAHLLSRQNGNFLFDLVTNDRLWVKKRDDGEVDVIGSPMPVLLGYGTMATVFELSFQLSLYRDEYYLLTKDWTRKHYEFSPQEFARFFSRKICTHAELIGIVNLKPGTTNLLTPVRKSEKRAEVMGNAARDLPHSYPNWLGIGHGPDERGMFTLSEDFPVYDLEFSYDSKSVLQTKEVIVNMFGDFML